MTYTYRFQGERLVDVDEYAEHLRDYDGYLMLQERAMRSIGAAAQTLAGLNEFVNKATQKTYASVPTIAEKACLSVLTVRRHLAQLEKMNLIKNLGREKPDPKKHARRTCTYVVAKCLRRGEEKYIELPRWAARRLSSWSDRAVYACIISRRLLVDRLESNGGCADDRLGLSAKEIRKATSLGERSVWRSLASLRDQGYIARVGHMMDRGDWCQLVLPKGFAEHILPKGINPSFRDCQNDTVRAV